VSPPRAALVVDEIGTGLPDPVACALDRHADRADLLLEPVDLRGLRVADQVPGEVVVGAPEELAVELAAGAESVGSDLTSRPTGKIL